MSPHSTSDDSPAAGGDVLAGLNPSQRQAVLHVDGPLLILAGPCQRSAGEAPHTWQPGDSADLVSYGDPDHGLSVWLGRCPRGGALADSGPHFY